MLISGDKYDHDMLMRFCSVLNVSMQFTAIMASQGVKVVPFELNYTTPANDIILAVMASEAAANFDYWQRSHRDDTNRRQDFWPPLLRLARMIPAVEYIQVIMFTDSAYAQMLACSSMPDIAHALHTTLGKALLCRVGLYVNSL